MINIVRFYKYVQCLLLFVYLKCRFILQVQCKRVKVLYLLNFWKKKKEKKKLNDGSVSQKIIGFSTAII